MIGVLSFADATCQCQDHFFLQDSEVHGELAFLFVSLAAICLCQYSKTIKLVNRKKSETNAAKKCSKMFHLIAYLGQRVGKKATTHTQTTIGWKCLPGCVFSPCWASIYNQNTIKAFLIAYLGQGADEKATIQTIFFGNASMVADLVPFDLVNTIQIQSKRFCWLRI